MCDQWASCMRLRNFLVPMWLDMHHLIDRVTDFGRSYFVAVIFCFGVGLLGIHFLSKESIGAALRGWLTMIMLLIVLAFVAVFLGENVKLSEVLMLLYLYGIVLYVLLCDLFWGLAQTLTRRRGKKWVKELDYVYLTLGVIGILGTLNKIDVFSGGISRADVLAPLVLVTAIVVRFIKTRAEIAGWNKPRA